MKLKASEADHQKAVVAWARMQGIKGLIAYTAGTKLAVKGSFAAVNQMKAMGMELGVPDLFLARTRGKYAGLWIEMKSDKGRLRLEQEWWRDFLLDQTYDWKLCRSADEAVATIKRYLEIE